MPNQRLVLNGVEDFIDGEPEWSKLLYHLYAQSGLGERIWSVCCFISVGPKAYHSSFDDDQLI